MISRIGNCTTAVKMLAILASAAISFGCGGGGSSSVVSNPVPAISSISPITATRGGPAFTLTVNGSSFVSGAAVQWNGGARQTTLVNANQLTAQIAADDISVAGTENVTVVNPVPGGGTSNSLSFNIPCVLVQPGPASSQTVARLGAYYFDGWAGPLNSYHLQQLVNTPYQDRQPLSGWRDDNTCAIEEQLAWAHSFGLDFFVYEWNFVTDPTEDLNSAIKITHALPDRQGMQYALMYTDGGGSSSINNTADWTTAVNEWISYMSDPAYLMVNGEPLFIVLDIRNMRQAFGSSSAVLAAFKQLRTAAQTAGFPGVYIVGDFPVNWLASGYDGLFPDLSMAVADGYDAVSTYGYAEVQSQGATAGMQPFSLLSDAGNWIWSEAALKSPVPIIPTAMTGWDPRPCAAAQDPACPWSPQSVTWLNRTPLEVATFVGDLITLAESNPQVRVEPSPAPPIVLMEAWNELTEGSYIVPTVGDGTSYGDALAAALTSPGNQVRSVLTLSDSGPSNSNRTASGTLTDSTGAPIAGATITLTDIPATGSYAPYQLSGQAPAAATEAQVGFRVNTDDPNTLGPASMFAGPDATSFSLYQVSYVQPADGVQRVPNGDFSAGAQSWSLQGQTQIVQSDRGPGQMVQVVATAAQFATLDSAQFPVTASAPFQLSFSARVVPSNSGSFIVYFRDANGNVVNIPAPSVGASNVESIPITAAKVPLGSATTDSAGNFQFSLTSLGTSEVKLEANYPGDAQHWPGYAQAP